MSRTLLLCLVTLLIFTDGFNLLRRFKKTIKRQQLCIKKNCKNGRKCSLVRNRKGKLRAKCMRPTDPCLNVECDIGEQCTLGECTPVVTCASILCAPGFTCVDNPFIGGSCQPETDPCAAVTCLTGTICKDGVCENPCATARCGLGLGCVNDIDSDGNVVANCCGTNTQEFNSCGTACPSTCEEQGTRVCTRQCVQECQCKSGLVREFANATGNCIEPSECPLPPLTCANVLCTPGNTCIEGPDGPVCVPLPPVGCEAVTCLTGTICKDGICLDPCSTTRCGTGRNCVNDIDSEGNVFANCCGSTDELFDECGTACPATCNSQTPSLCPTVCNPACFCKPGLIRESANGSCIDPNACPTTP